MTDFSTNNIDDLKQRSTEHYIGHELDTFQHATQWKNYCNGHISHYLKGDVLEVGAGKGATTRILCHDGLKSWTCLEPDGNLCEQLKFSLDEMNREFNYTVIQGTVANLTADRKYDTILYFDVLEHIEDDRAEIQTALQHLKQGGHLIVLSPAYEWLYSSFDKAIGHFRRYDKGSLKRLVPAELQPVKLCYLDSMGIALSWLNKFVLRSTHPTMTQILFWDQRVVPLSERIDKILGYRLGKSILGIWQMNG